MRWSNFPQDCVWPKLKEGILCERNFFPNHIITYLLTHNEVVKHEKDATKHDISCDKIIIFSTYHIYRAYIPTR
jgi:hypothetical protein